MRHFAEGLADRQAADLVRGRIDWQDALGVALEDDGVAAAVLRAFRGRLVANDAALLLLTTLLERCREVGLRNAGGQQRTDATPVVAAMHARNRRELAGETVRQTVNVLATVAPAWLRAVVPADGHARDARPLSA